MLAIVAVQHSSSVSHQLATMPASNARHTHPLQIADMTSLWSHHAEQPRTACHPRPLFLFMIVLDICCNLPIIHK